MNAHTPAEHYELLGELAQGGMATVFIGRLRRHRNAQLVAIKSMKQDLAADEGFTTMFLDEAALTVRIQHPNVVQTLDVAAEGGKLFIVMEYVEGVALGRLLELTARAGVSIPPRIAVAIVCDLLRGLHAAHELIDGNGRPLNVVHRDVSPFNIIVGTDGMARILDFGVAKASSQRHVTMRGEIKGKLAYMPPEQALGDAVDRRSDVYAAGVVLWETLTNRRLFRGRNEEELVRQIFEGHIDPPSLVADEMIPSGVDHVTLRALERDRAGRWESARQMADMLASALAPAPRDEVAALVRLSAAADLAERAQLIRKLDARAINAEPLDVETQTLQSILTHRTTGRGAPRPDRTVPLQPLPPLPTHGEVVRTVPLPFVPAPPPPVVHPVRSSSRRALRRKRRRLRVLLGFGIAIVVILILMAGALILGRVVRSERV